MAPLITGAEATICVFAKPPVPGKAKTRLGRSIGDKRAAQLADAFLHDTLNGLRQITWATVVVASTGRFSRPYMNGLPLWIQPDATLDVRIETMVQRALQSTPMAFALGADSPGLPVRYLAEARDALATHDAVLGPSADGGFYLLGLKRCPPGLLREIEWSRSSTLSQTVSRLRRLGFSLALLREWLDVDTADDLANLELLIEQSAADCRFTQRLLRTLRGAVVGPLSRQ